MARHAANERNSKAKPLIRAMFRAVPPIGRQEKRVPDDRTDAARLVA
jgi:hypothetical protein